MCRLSHIYSGFIKRPGLYFLISFSLVDGQPQDFDPNISVPVEGTRTDMVRKDYVMPFTFHLHEGTNIIRLHMAGGYRSTFYNFTFRPYVENPEP